MQQRGVEFQEATSAEDAIRSSQLIVPVTTTTTGYIQFGWLQPGAILVNISLDDFLPEVVFQADKVIVDSWDLVKNDPRRLIGRMYRAGQIIGPDEPVRTSEIDSISDASMEKLETSLLVAKLGENISTISFL